MDETNGNEGTIEALLLKAGAISFEPDREKAFELPGRYRSPIRIDLNSVFKDKLVRARLIDAIVKTVTEFLNSCPDKEQVKIVGVKHQEQAENEDGTRTEELAKEVATALSMDFSCASPDSFQIEGAEVNRNDKVIVIDDIIVTGVLTITAIKRLWGARHPQVIGVVAVMDYGFPEGACWVRDYRIPIISVTDSRKIIRAAYKGKYIDRKTVDILAPCVYEPLEW